MLKLLMVMVSHDLNKTGLDHNAILVSKNEVSNMTIRMKYLCRNVKYVCREGGSACEDLGLWRETCH